MARKCVDLVLIAWCVRLVCVSICYRKDPLLLHLSLKPQPSFSLSHTLSIFLKLSCSVPFHHNKTTSTGGFCHRESPKTSLPHKPPFLSLPLLFPSLSIVFQRKRHRTARLPPNTPTAASVSPCRSPVDTTFRHLRLLLVRAPPLLLFCYCLIFLIVKTLELVRFFCFVCGA